MIPKSGNRFSEKIMHNEKSQRGRSEKLIRVTEAVVASTPAFRFAKPFSGLEVVPHEGDVIAWDGDRAVRAPYDNCVLVMPVPNNVKTGLTAVRLGRIVAR